MTDNHSNSVLRSTPTYKGARSAATIISAIKSQELAKPADTQDHGYLIEAATARFRSFLVAQGRGQWRIFADAFPIATCYDWDRLVERYEATHHALPLNPCGEQPELLNHLNTQSSWRTGVLLFHTLPLAVYTWLGPPDISEREKGCNRPLLELLAAPDPSSIEQLNADFRDLEEEGRYWGQIRNAKQITKSEKIDESFDWDRMTVPDDLRRRIETEVLGFFTEESKLAHRRLRVPYRRGVLLWGPPGNGKTTMMRLLAAKLEDARMLLLPRSKLQDDQDIEAAMAFAKSHTPAVLLLEDIDSMFQSMVTMSRFLNLLDGLDVSHGDCASDGGLLVVATTNHPDKLDPAINSRPGRFDTLIEFPLPDAVQRRRYLAGGAEAVPASMRETLVGQTRGMSYVHLRELFKLANLYALNRNSPERDETDLMAALETLRSDFQAGCQGFQGQAEAGFGFATR